MGQPPAHSITMRFLDTSLKLYRKTLKRYRPAHLAMHRVMDEWVLPALERRRDFQTIADDPFWFRLELLTGRHETETGAVLRRLAFPGMVALDIGAHVGYFTRLLSRLAGQKGQVIAFEPHPRTCATLRRNTGHLPNVRVLQAAVSEADGSAELHDYLMMSASGSLGHDESLARQQRGQMRDGDFTPRGQPGFTARSYTVDTISIDGCLSQLGVGAVDVIKMDIEGAELSALRGMRETIRKSPNLALVMEYNPAALAAFGNDPEAALAEALAMGFRSMHAIADDGSLHDWTHDANLLTRETARLTQSMGVVNLLLRR